MEISQDLQPPITQENIVTQSEKKKTSLVALLGIGTLLTAVIAGSIGYYFGSKTQISGVIQPGQEACTLEAKLCPDGSSVGRSGPNCEFAECPVSAIDSPNSSTLPNGWKRVGNVITSSEGCYKVQITDIGSLDDMGYYVAESYPEVTTFAQSNYFANTYKTLVVPSQGIGEGEKIYVDVNGSVYEVAVNYTGKGEGTVATPAEVKVCEQREKELEQVINSITFSKNTDLGDDQASGLMYTNQPDQKDVCAFFYYAEFSVTNNMVTPTISLGATAIESAASIDLYVKDDQGKRDYLTTVSIPAGETIFSEPMKVPAGATKLTLNGCTGWQEVDLAR